MVFLRCLLLVGLFFCTLGVANAADWVAEKVRQPAHYSYNGQPWAKIEVGKAMPSGSWVQTGPRGRLVLKRGEEFIQFKPKTMAAIGKTDQAGKKTLVMQKFGSLLLDVETRKRKRKHLTVETPFLAAVVKGTRFSVDVGQRSTNLSVERGVVEVTDERRGLQTDVRSNQSVTVQRNAKTAMRVTGPGKRASIKNVKPSVPKVEPEPVKKSILETVLGFSKNKRSTGSTNKSSKKSNGNGNSGSNNESGNSGNDNSSSNNSGGNGNGNSGSSNSSSSNSGSSSSSSNGGGNGNGGSNGGGNGNGNNGNGNGNGKNK